MSVTNNPYAGYEIVVAIDVSSSMDTTMKECEGKTRLQVVRGTIMELFEKLFSFDKNGLDVVFFGRNVKHMSGVDSLDRIAKEFDRVLKVENEKERWGTATLATVNKLFEIHQMNVKNQGTDLKSTICLIVTDGEPSDCEFSELKARILEIAKQVRDHAAIAFSWLQVGDAKGATELLQALDDFAPKELDICDTKKWTDLMLTEKVSLLKVIDEAIND